ncbi:MAG TPA: pyridoxamine 5'-phosphate oxidase family protein [Pilimelia sp.]|nr:pyridoxamine 5'-phosphate oxidase family protein [Pilimelia sp.]
MTTPGEPSGADAQRRPLTHDERVALLGRPLVGILSTVNAAAWVHSVPVFYLYRDGEIRILCGVDSVKARNARRTGRATFCVEVTEADRRFVTVMARARVEQPVLPADLHRLDEQYGRTDFSSGWDAGEFEGAAMLILTPVRWIAWADWD